MANYTLKPPDTELRLQYIIHASKLYCKGAGETYAVASLYISNR